MRNRIVAAVAALSLLVTGTAVAGTHIGSAATTKTVHVLCVHVERHTSYPSYGDLNLYRGSERVCIKGRRGHAGATGATGARGPQGPAGPPGPALDASIAVCLDRHPDSQGFKDIRVCQAGDAGFIGYIVAP